LKQLEDFDRPIRTVIAAGGAWHPILSMTASTGAQILAKELVKAASTQAQFFGGFRGANLLVTKIMQEVTN